MDSFLLLRRLVAAIVFKGQTVSDYWWSRRTIFLTTESLQMSSEDNALPPSRPVTKNTRQDTNALGVPPRSFWESSTLLAPAGGQHRTLVIRKAFAHMLDLPLREGENLNYDEHLGATGA